MIISGVLYIINVLSRQLKELEADGLVIPTEYMQIPPKVGYKLSEKGKTLLPILEAMRGWGKEYVHEKELPAE